MSEARAIGYVVNAFPVVSETFLVNELRALTARGLTIVVLPIGDRRDRSMSPETDLPSVSVVRPPHAALRSLRGAAIHVAVAVRAPREYLSLLRRTLRSIWVARWHGEGALRRAGRRWRRFGRAVWLARACHRHGVVHLHAYFANRPLELVRAAARLTGLSFSFAAHAKDLYTTPDAALRRALRQARFAVACHRDGVARLRNLACARAGRVLYVIHGTDLARFHPSADAVRETGLLLAVGRLTPKKGFDVLVAACARLREQGRRFRCVIAGDGRLRSELEAAIGSARLSDCVEILGFQSQAELAAWYRRGALFVMPSRTLQDGNRDGIPNVVVEAMASGVPVIATRAGSIPELVDDGVNGRLVSAEDPQALAAAIAELLDDDALGRRFAVAARESVAQLDFHECVAPLARKFARIVARDARCVVSSSGDDAETQHDIRHVEQQQNDTLAPAQPASCVKEQ